MLHITAIPDDNRIGVDYMDRRGTKFQYPGNFNLPETGDFDVERLVLGGTEGGMASFDRPDFAVNLICDPDENRKGLEAARKIVEEQNIPVLNRPERVLGTSRDRLYERFAQFEGLHVPKSLRVRPRRCREIRELIDQQRMGLPCIFRPAGGHNSRGVFLIERLDDVDQLEKYAFDGREYYLIEFVDYRDPDGRYRKFRVVFIDGELYPRHLFVADDWQVSMETNLSGEEFIEQEARFLGDFRRRLGERGIARLKAFCGEIGLEFFGLDMSIRPDGRLLLFEANPCMGIFLDSGRRPHVKPYKERIRRAATEMLRRFHRRSLA